MTPGRVLTARPFPGDLAPALRAARLRGAQAGDTEIFWLGQAGFAIFAAGRFGLIDPYLSDSLAEKYRGTARPHERMMPVPVAVRDLPEPDFVLLTHRHGDHMDPGTLPRIAKAFPAARFIFPEAERAEAALRSGLDPADPRLTGTDAGARIALSPGLSLRVFAAAHETPETDMAGQHRFLGYGLETPDLRLWHSGDCVPFEGLVSDVTDFAPDIALLPVNGRDPVLTASGVPGNFSLEEAAEIACAVGAGTLLAHHYGMFAFNTCAPGRIDAMTAQRTDLAILRAMTGVAYCVG